MSIKEKLLNTSGIKKAEEKLGKVAAPARQGIQKGKDLQSKIDSKIEVSTVEFASYYVSILFYDAVMSPLNSMCRLITSVTLISPKGKLLVAAGGILGGLAVLFVLVGIMQGYALGVSYPLGAIIAWYAIYHQTTKEDHSGVDDCILECMSQANIASGIHQTDDQTDEPEQTEDGLDWLLTNEAQQQLHQQFGIDSQYSGSTPNAQQPEVTQQQDVIHRLDLSQLQAPVIEQLNTKLTDDSII